MSKSWTLFGSPSPTIESQNTRESRVSMDAISDSVARLSKFPDLKGFVQNDSHAPCLTYTNGQALPYAEVGRVFFINHPQDEEINHRVIVIWRTNKESWSCYGFCKNDDKYDCENKQFQKEHIKVVATPSATSQTNVTPVVANTSATRRIDTKPVVAIDLGTTKEKLVLADHIWINCREVLDIKHTVKLAQLGRVAPNDRTYLLKRGEDVFHSTFADRDKAPSSGTKISKSRQELSNDIFNVGRKKR